MNKFLLGSLLAASAMARLPLDASHGGRALSQDIGVDVGDDSAASACEADPVASFEACADEDTLVSSPCASDGDLCVVKHANYAQCLPATRLEEKVEAGWDGRVLACEPMPFDAPRSYDPEILYYCGDDCAEPFGQCGGKGYESSVECCDPNTECVVKNIDYAQCLPKERAQANVLEEGWNGRVLTCKNETEPDPCLPCADAFQKCAGEMDAAVSCCNPAAKCVVKNWFYAQCVLPEHMDEKVDERWDLRELKCGATMYDDLEPEEEPEMASGPIEIGL